MISFDDTPAEAPALTFYFHFFPNCATRSTSLLNFLQERDVNLSPDFNRSSISNFPSNDINIILGLSFSGKYRPFYF